LTYCNRRGNSFADWLRRFACCSPLVCAPWFITPLAATAEVPEQTPLYQFAIDAIPLANALLQFVSQSGAGVIVGEGVDTTKTVNAVNDELGIEDALQQMLHGLPFITEKNTAGFYIIRALETEAAAEATATPTLEELVVTGTLIRGGIERSLNPVQVIDRQQLDHTGNPTVIDLIATLPEVSGTENQSNQFHNVNAAGTANVNLRGLGVSRTLVLLNGKRLPVSGLPHNDGQAFVDLQSIPAMALEQVDILKDGAGATYGSDAVAGVVNFITRSDVNGLELSASGKYIDEGDGDWDIGLLGGGDWGIGRWLAAFSYNRRNELANDSREEVIATRIDIEPLQRRVLGVSALGNPGAFIPIDATTAIDGVTDEEAAVAAGGRDNYVRDPQCQAVGGIELEGGRCGFEYVPFDNLVEEEDRWQFFGSVQWPLEAGGIGQQATFYSELNYTLTELTDWKTSPSYPPVKEADNTRYLPAEHPALVDFLADNPGILEKDGDIADFSGGAIFVGRPQGVAGSSSSGFRSQENARWLAGVRGEYGLAYDLSFAYGRNRAEARTLDTLIEHWQMALAGFGGPHCNGTVAGTNGCEYYNPFASAIAGSPSYEPTLANSSALMAWLREELIQEYTSELLVADALFSSHYETAANRRLDFAFGFQYRQELLRIRFNDLGDVSINPGESTVPGELPGVFIFFRGGREDDVSQNVAALFAEMAMPLQDNIHLQMAVRFENYGGAIGHSIDPKLALHWQLSPQWSLRAAASTAFRAPSLNQTSLDSTTLELIGASFAFKAVDRLGNPELEPEQVQSQSVGLMWSPNSFWRLQWDYWRFDFRDVIVQESANAIVNQVLSDPQSPYAPQVVFDDSGNIARILSRYINGPDILVDGLDFSGEFLTPLEGASLSLGWNLAYLHRYDIGRSDLLPAFSAAGRLNTATFVQSLPRWQGNLFLDYQRDFFNLRLVMNGIGGYRDDGLSILEQSELAAFVTERDVSGYYGLDAYIFLTLSNGANGGNSRLGLSLLNITNREPPAVREDMRFDTTLHNAFGRMVKLSLHHRF